MIGKEEQFCRYMRTGNKRELKETIIRIPSIFIWLILMFIEFMAVVFQMLIISKFWVD